MSKKKIHTIRRSKSKIDYEKNYVLVLTKTNKNIYAQILLPKVKKTLKSFNSVNIKDGTKTEKSTKVGNNIAIFLTESKIDKIVVDRNGNLYSGRIKSLVESIKTSSNVKI
jgi:ribosomal protein L18